MKSTWIAGLLALTVFSIAMAPSSSYAGKSEWATAGKILTGAVIVHVLKAGIDTEHHGYRETQCGRSRNTMRHRGRAPHRYGMGDRHHDHGYGRGARHSRTEVIIYNPPARRSCGSRSYRDRHHAGGERIIIRRR